jgi:hypothetical protein
MAFAGTTTFEREPDLKERLNSLDGSREIENRLEILLAENAETARAKQNFQRDSEQFEAELMRRPLTSSQAFSYFGLMLGALTPASIFGKILLSANGFRPDESWVVGVFLIINIISSVVGYFSGKLIARMVMSVEKLRWPVMLTILPLIGILWGIMAGGAGGFIVFVVGAFFGAALGTLVGGTALPVFAVLHRLLKRGDMIEARHFLPAAFGITLTICAFIFGL